MRASRPKKLTEVLLWMSMLPWGATSMAQSLPDDFFPESIAVADGGALFLGSSVEGTIVRIPAGGQAAVPFIPAGSNGLMSVQGLLVDDASRTLWACTADLGVAKTAKGESALLAFDLATGQPTGRWPLTGGGFCNDIAVAADGALLITDTVKPRILRFDHTVRRLSVWLEHPLLGGQPFNGNGIALDGSNVFVSTFADGRLLRVPVLADGEAGTPVVIGLPRPLSGGDALRRAGPGQFLVFENGLPAGGGQVTLMLVERDRAVLMPVASDIAEPVSGLVRDDQVVVVESQFGKLFGAAKGQVTRPFRLRTLPLPILPASIGLPKELPYPNGIAAAADGTTYVGSITGGRILRQRPGAPWEIVFPGSDAIYAATSLRLDEPRGLLWGASPDFLPGDRARPHRVFALDLATGAVSRVSDMPDGGFGNDIAIDPDGGVLVTDSFGGRVFRIAPDADVMITLVRDPLLGPIDGIGAGGIARAQDGRLIVGNYGAGRLVAIEQGRVREIALPRPIANPDGLAFDRDGTLILLEGDVPGGNGRVLRIREPFAPGERVIEILAEGLESPVNLSLTPDGRALITESRIRHRLVGDDRTTAPAAFRILSLALPKGDRP